MSFTIKSKYTDEGAIYKNLNISTKATTGAKVVSCVITALVITPIVLASIFGPIAFLSYIGSMIISIIVIGISVEMGVDNSIEVRKHDGMAEYYDTLSKSVAFTLKDLSEYEEEIRNSVDPNTLYSEVLEKLTKYRNLVQLGKGTVAEKDLGLYHKNMKLLLETCRKIRQDDLLITDQVLYSTLNGLGELQKDK